MTTSPLHQHFTTGPTVEATASLDQALWAAVMQHVVETNPTDGIDPLRMRVTQLLTDHGDNRSVWGAGGKPRTGWVRVHDIAPAFADLTGPRWPTYVDVVAGAVTLAERLIDDARAGDIAAYAQVLEGMEVVALSPTKAEQFGYPTSLADGRHRLLALIAAGVPAIRVTLSEAA